MMFFLSCLKVPTGISYKKLLSEFKVTASVNILAFTAAIKKPTERKKSGVSALILIIEKKSAYYGYLLFVSQA